jgi:hypothetical protein
MPIKYASAKTAQLVSWAVFALAYLISFLKSKFTADIIHIPTLQKFSNPIDSFDMPRRYAIRCIRGVN